MSKYIARVGSTKAKYKFNVAVEEVYFEVMPITLLISVSLAKGNRRTETKERVEISPQNRRVAFSEELEMINTIYTLKKGDMQQKMATFFVNCYKKGKPSKIGYAKVDLSKYANQTVGAPLKLELLKTPKKTKAYLRINICATLIAKNISDDLQSNMSGVSSLGDFDDLGMGSDSDEEKDPPKIGTFSPPKIQSQSRVLGIQRGGPIRAQAIKNEVFQDEPARVSEQLESAKQEQQDQQEESSVKKAAPIKIQRGQIKVSQIHRSGLPSGAPRPPPNRVPFTRQLNRDISEIQEDEAEYQPRESDLTPERDLNSSFKRDAVGSPSDFKTQMLEQNNLKLQQQVTELSQQLKQQSIQRRMSMSEDPRVKELESEITRLRLVIEDQKLDKDLVDRQRDNISSQSKTAQRELSTLQNKLEAAEDELKKAKQEADDSKTELREMEEHYDDLKSQYSRLNFQCEQFQTNNSKLIKENETLGEELKTLRGKINKSRENMNQAASSQEFEKYRASTDIMVSDLRGQVNILQSKLGALKDEQRTHEQEVSKMSQTFGKREKELLDQVAGLKGQKKELLEKQREMEMQLKETQLSTANKGGEFEISKLKLELQSAEGKAQVLSAQIKAKDQKIDTLTRRVEELENQSLGQETEGQERVNEIKRRYRDEIQQLKNELDDEKNKVVAMQYEHQKEIDELQAFHGGRGGGGVSSALNSQLKTVESKLNEKEKLLKEMKAENDKLRHSLTQRREELKAASSTKDTELGQLIVQNDFLKVQVADLEQSLQKYERVPKEEKSDALKEILHGLKQENAGLNDSVVHFQQEHAIIQQELAQSKTLMAAAEAKIESLDTKLREKNEQWEALATHVNTLEIELVKSKQQLGEAMNQINDFQLGISTGGGGKKKK